MGATSCVSRHEPHTRGREFFRDSRPGTEVTYLGACLRERSILKGIAAKARQPRGTVCDQCYGAVTPLHAAVRCLGIVAGSPTLVQRSHGQRSGGWDALLITITPLLGPLYIRWTCFARFYPEVLRWEVFQRGQCPGDRRNGHWEETCSNILLMLACVHQARHESSMLRRVPEVTVAGSFAESPSSGSL